MSQDIYESQKEFCKKNNYPLFAPEKNCWSCGKDIWSKFTPYEAGSRLITSCPYCQRSFTD